MSILSRRYDGQYDDDAVIVIWASSHISRTYLTLLKLVRAFTVRYVCIVAKYSENVSEEFLVNWRHKADPLACPAAIRISVMEDHSAGLRKPRSGLRGPQLQIRHKLRMEV